MESEQTSIAMKRLALEVLKKWQANDHRKPLLLRGARQVGKTWIETSDFQECTAIHRAIVDTYRQDFSKYAQKFQVKYVSLLFDFIPSKAGQQFKFMQVPGEYRKRDLAPALELLVKAGVVHQVVHSAGTGIPLGAQANPEIFKLIFLDIALAQTILGVEATSWILEPEANFINKGEMTEAFVGQEMLAYLSMDQKAQLYYWSRQTKSSSAEVDYLIQCNHDIIPVEVKSGSPGTLKSLRLFLEQHKTSKYGIRVSALNYARDQNLHSFPLYAVAKVMRFKMNMRQPGG
jgi:predicted AAA+ superfamily ATPase